MEQLKNIRDAFVSAAGEGIVFVGVNAIDGPRGDALEFSFFVNGKTKVVGVQPLPGRPVEPIEAAREAGTAARAAREMGAA